MKTGGKVFAIDANVIIRYLVGDNKELVTKATTIMENLASGYIRVVCDPVTLAEIVWVLSKTYNIPREQIRSSLESLIMAEGFLIPDKPLYQKALHLFGSSVPHFGDACACALAMKECNGDLLSFDRKLSHVEGINRKESYEH